MAPRHQYPHATLLAHFSGLVTGVSAAAPIKIGAHHAANGAARVLPDHQAVERLFGAGGPQMAAAGVDLAFDLTAHSVVGLSDVLRKQLKFRQLLRQLFLLALERVFPDAVHHTPLQ